ncbi:peptidase M50 [Tolypothrix sp. NIES-4075]|uniref:site-2 protease family protein n=1 Tax=Tolypothrix sp. NIES-4075 TaxID=2005459 RepID=UPI000B66FD54|nr:site-2 protease family protein [Tolypothrix sp. NIES-4075]GAX45050.1 peptidase M50 [Tolypothrix sp. NIES-4075]
MQYLFYPLVIYALLFVLRYLLVFLQLCKLTLQYPKYQVQTADKVPVYLKKLFKTAIAELEQFGFKPCSYLQVEEMVKRYPSTTWEILLYHKALKTYAKVAIRRPVEPINLFDVEFYTVFQDKTVLLTMNGKQYNVVGEIPNYIIQDSYTASISVHWQAHQDKLSQLTQSKTPCVLAPDVFGNALQAYGKDYINSLAKVKTIQRIKGSELFRVYWLAALKITHQIQQGAKKVAPMIQQRRQQAKTDKSIQIEIPIELEVEGFQRMDYQQQGLVGKKFRTGLLIISLLCFVASYTRISPQSLLILLGVLLLHEGGHLLAMKLCGYQDTSMLFIPFLGAVATARKKDDATLTQQFWVSLAGPLPGLILGVGLAMAQSVGFANATRGSHYSSWVSQLAWTLISLNIFNLLPVYPLDGGHIANLLLFSRFPYTDVLFKVFGVIVLSLLGINQPGLFLFAILVAFSIPLSFRTAKVNLKLRKELRQNPPKNQEHLLHFIFEHIKLLGYGNLPFGTRYTMAKDLIQRYYQSGGKWTTRVFLIILYFASLLGGVAGSLQAIAPYWVSVIPHLFESRQQSVARIRKDKQREVERLTETLRLNPNDVNAYVKRAQVRALLRDYKGVLADYDQIVRLKPNDISSRLQRAWFRRRLGDNQGALADYNEILRLNPKHIQTYHQRAQMRNILQDYKGAIQDYSEIIKLDAKDTRAYLSRGYVRFSQLQDYKGALADANYIIQLNSEAPDGYQLRSQIRRRLKDEKGAIADEQKAEVLYQALENMRAD